MPYAIIDSSIWIDHWEATGAFDPRDIPRIFLVRHSSVVLSELRRGARTIQARRKVDALRRSATEIWTPNDADWRRAGELIQEIGDAEGWEASKRRDFQNDALIALTAMHRGATVITRNARDFELIAEQIPVSVLPLA